jgi:hypothetical protein
MRANSGDSSKSLLTHLMIAGTAALAGSAANAQIVVTNVNENIGFAPGDVSSFVSSLPGPIQFNIYRHSGFTRSIGMQSKRVHPIPPSVSAYLQMKASGNFSGFFRRVSILTVPAGKKWGSPSSSTSAFRSAKVVSVYHLTTTVHIPTVGGSTTSTNITLPTTRPSSNRFSDSYFAFRFTDANRGYQLDYGWIKASLTDNTYDGLNLHIDSYAYDASGAQIAMGETVAPVPEPNLDLALAALSALTLGAAGVKRFKALRHTHEANR